MLGGTTDRCFAFTAAAIFGALVRVWEAALATGARVVAVTVPERAAEYVGQRGGAGRAKREELNRLIRGWGAEGWWCLDLVPVVRWGGGGRGGEEAGLG